MLNKRPIIGVTGPDEGGTGAWLFTALSVRLAGGKPRRITVENTCTIDDIDGLIIGGGADVEPLRYGQERIERVKLAKDSRTIFEWVLSILFFPIYWLARYFQSTKSATISTERDELELDLLAGALRYRKPVLGICRGMQLMNVHFRGSLHQDISGYYQETPQVASIFPKKRIEVLPGSLLAEILNTTVCNVNALHNQAIDIPGEGVELVANEQNTEIIQGLEHPDYPYVIGVQWHPEYLIQIRRQRRIFKRLVHEAKEMKSEQKGSRTAV